MNSLKKICVVGAGRWGLNHVRTLNELKCLAGVVDKNSLITNKIKSVYKDCYTFSSLESSFDANFDGYIVATPPKTHYELARKIIQKGKPVLVEKPLTLSLKNAIKLNALAKRKKVNLMVGHVLLFHPAFRKIKDLIENNQIGKIQYIYSNRLNLGSFRNDENVLWSFAPHDIALFDYFFESSPNSVVSNGIDILQEGIHDTSITSFKYDGNRMGHIFVSWLHPFKEHRFVIVGSKGMIHFEDSEKKKPLIFYDKKVELGGKLPKSKLGNNYEIKFGDELPLTAELKYFISKINEGEIKISNGDSAVKVMDLLERATKSLISNN